MITEADLLRKAYSNRFFTIKEGTKTQTHYSLAVVFAGEKFPEKVLKKITEKKYLANLKKVDPENYKIWFGEEEEPTACLNILKEKLKIALDDIVIATEVNEAQDLLLFKTFNLDFIKKKAIFI